MGRIRLADRRGVYQRRRVNPVQQLALDTLMMMEAVERGEIEQATQRLDHAQSGNHYNPDPVLAAAERLLRPGGVFVMEHGDQQGASTRALVGGPAWTEVGTQRDLAGRDRALIARRGAGVVDG